MSMAALIAMAVTIGILLTLVTTTWPADTVFLAGVTILLLTGVLDTEQAFAGLGNSGVITVGLLYVLATGLQETGAIAFVASRFLRPPRSLRHAQWQLLLPTAAMSAFLNNTPIVAMMIPVTLSWARKHGLAASQLLLPLNYATVLGGTCTLIGTSTNLVIYGLLAKTFTEVPLGFFDLAWVGMPMMAAGLFYLVVATPRLLPNRQQPLELLEDVRRYTVEMVVAPDGPLVGRSIEQAGLRHLSGMYLAEIGRSTQTISAVGPEERLEGGDQLVFVGVVDSVVELQRIRGLLPATAQVFKLQSPRSERLLVEAVVAPRSFLVGKTIKEATFRNRYQAVVIAVMRDGERLDRKLGDITLRSGDTLLLEAQEGFVDRHRHSRDFLLTSPIAASNPPRHDKLGTSVLVLVAMVLLAGSGLLSMLEAALLAAFAMLALRCCRIDQARRNIDWPTLLTIALSFGVGSALQQSGAAGAIAKAVLQGTAGSQLGSLAGCYLLTAVLTQVITNNAAAALMFPITMALCQQLHAPVAPFALALMFGASNSFATPYAYQTNLMVYGPGGYRFGDYLRLGLPLMALCAVLTILGLGVLYGLAP